MNPVTTLVNYFQENPTLIIKENFKELLVTVNLSNILTPQSEDIKQVTGFFAERDKLTIDFYFEEMDPVTYHANEEPEQFIQEIQRFTILKDEDSTIILKISIEKSVDENNEMSIYFFENFTEYLSNLNFIGSLYILKNIRADRPFIKFNLINESQLQNFGTNSFMFFSNEDHAIINNINREKILDGRNSIGNFNNASDYQFIPEDFYLYNKSGNSNFDDFFDRLCILFSIIFVSDFSNIIDENKLYLKLNGYKLIECVLPYKNFNIENNKTFYDIYKWIYNEGNLSDKAGLARNIISLHVKQLNSTISLPENTINSIKSGYEIYLKENVAQYIEVKNKVSEFLLDLAQRTSELVNSFANALRNNHFLFLTFFISVFVFNTLSTGKLKDIFNKDITYISYGLLLISFFYLIATIIQTNIETNRFKLQYNRLKKLYDDILNEQDIKNIFKDEDHKEDIKFIVQKASVYSFVWLIEIVILYTVIYLLRI